MNPGTWLLAVVPLIPTCQADTLCSQLHTGNSLKASASRSHPACFLVEVIPGEATQLEAEQPEDLEMEVEAAATRVLSDGFQFGAETVTISVAGSYRVFVRPVDLRVSSVSFTMSRRQLSLQEAGIWRNAENLAMISKRSAKPADIADSLRAWEQIGNQAAVARTWLKQGDSALDSGDASRALASYEKALALCRTLEDLRCSAEAANNSGLLSQLSGDMEDAANRLEEAAEDWGRMHNEALQGITLSNIGMLYWLTNDFTRAISVYDQAGRVLRSRDKLANARVLSAMGLCYQSLGQYPSARRYFEHAIAIESLMAAGARPAVHARLNLGRNYMLQGETTAAQRILERAVEDATALAYSRGLADSLSNLGQNLLKRREPEQARETLGKALLLHRELGDRRGEAVDLQFLGEAAVAWKDTSTARSYFTQAIEIRRRCSLREATTDSLYSLAILDRNAGLWNQARDLAEQAVTLLESVGSDVPEAELRASWYARKRKFFDLLVQIEMSSSGPGAAEAGLLAAERGRARALLDILAGGTVMHLVPRGLLQRRTSIRRKIDLLAYQLSTNPPSREAGLREKIDALVADGDAVEARIRETAERSMPGPPLQSVACLREKVLPRDSVLIEYHLAEPQSYLWLVQPTGTRNFLLPPRAAIEARSRHVIDLFGRFLDRRRSPALETAFHTSIHRLSEMLLAPLREVALPGRLIIVPDGILNQVPFAALQFGPKTQCLGLTRDLVQMPAAVFLENGKTPRAAAEFPLALLGITDPVFSPDDPRVPAADRRIVHFGDFDLPRLPFTTELDTVVRMVPDGRVRILRGFDANSSTLRNIRTEDYAVLHFSTHALIDDRIPEVSRIALSMVTPEGRTVDGFLHPYDLAKLRLNGSTVVLSACGTALGKQVIGEGLYGLTASLFQAGAAQLVLSLSEVDAEGSAEYFSEVYRHFFAPRPSSMEHSLTLARRAFAASSRWSDPFYWASFVIIGRPSEFPDARVRSLAAPSAYN